MKNISLGIPNGGPGSYATWALYFGKKIPHPGNLILISKRNNKKESLPFNRGSSHIGGGIIRSYLFKGSFGKFF